MAVLFDQFDPRFWRYNVINYLDNWSMLVFIQTSKGMNIHKHFTYRIIFQKLIMNSYDKFVVREYTIYNLYDCIYDDNHIKKRFIELVKNNKILRTMIQNYIIQQSIQKKKYYVPI